MSSYPVVNFQSLPSSAASDGSGGRLGYSSPPLATADANHSATTNELVRGMFDTSAATSGRSINLPTAAAAVAALDGAVVGTSVEFVVVNPSGQTITVAPGTGGSALGVMTVATTVSGHFRLRLTNVTSGSEAYQVQRLS